MPNTVRKIKGYEDGFNYGHSCALKMTRERRADNARMIRESDYFKAHSPTLNYWRGFVSAMETTLF